MQQFCSANGLSCCIFLVVNYAFAFSHHADAGTVVIMSLLVDLKRPGPLWKAGSSAQARTILVAEYKDMRIM